MCLLRRPSAARRWKCLLYNIGKSAEHLEISPEFDPITGVEVYSKDGDAEPLFASGDATGRVLKVVNPWVTSQAMADNILASVVDFEYQPFTADGALLDPAAELGDGITVNGVSSTIFKQDLEFSRLMKSDISAPHDEEVIHEYGGYVTPEERRYAREFDEIRAQLKIAADSISAEVVKKTGENSTHTFGWEITDNKWEVYKRDGDDDDSRQSLFLLDDEGNATFGGKVYASNIQTGGGYGYISGGMTSFAGGFADRLDDLELAVGELYAKTAVIDSLFVWEGSAYSLYVGTLRASTIVATSANITGNLQYKYRPISLGGSGGYVKYT